MKTLGMWLLLAGAATAQDRGTDWRVTVLKDRLGFLFFFFDVGSVFF
jgi:hypothetical protein